MSLSCAKTLGKSTEDFTHPKDLAIYWNNRMSKKRVTNVRIKTDAGEETQRLGKVPPQMR